MRELFQHPELKNKVTLEKRQADKVDISMLNIEQLTAYSNITRCINGNSGGIMVLSGCAGSGKTFLVSKIIENYLVYAPTSRVAFTATTNNAVEVNYRTCQFTSPMLTFSTIHKLLGLKEKINKDGTISFVPDPMNPSNISDYAVVFIDESSQFSRELWKHLCEHVGHTTHFIFIGDRFQTPPVGEPSSLIFIDKFKLDTNAVTYELTRIVRQAEDNPIIKVATYVRTNIHRPISIKDKFAGEDLIWNDDMGVDILRNNKAGKGYMDELLKHIFASPNFASDANYGKCVCWRNKTVAALSAGIRRMKYGKGRLRRIEPEEKIEARQPIFNKETDSIIISNGKQMEVVEFTRHEENINDGQFILPYYETLVKFEDMFGNHRTEYINIPTDIGVQVYESVLETLRNFAKSFKPGTQMSGRAWSDYYAFKKQFAEVSYSYAGTIHTAQGSTINNVVVFDCDISKNHDLLERNRILYTGVTRASERLWII